LQDKSVLRFQSEANSISGFQNYLGDPILVYECPVGRAVGQLDADISDHELRVLAGDLGIIYDEFVLLGNTSRVQTGGRNGEPRSGVRSGKTH
jgi:hypothetical protein